MNSRAALWGIGIVCILGTLLCLLWAEAGSDGSPVERVPTPVVASSVTQPPAPTDDSSSGVVFSIPASISSSPPTHVAVPPSPSPQPKEKTQSESAGLMPPFSPPPSSSAPPQPEEETRREQPEPPSLPPPLQQPAVAVATLSQLAHSADLVVRKKIKLGGRIIQHPTARDDQGRHVYWHEPLRCYFVLQDVSGEQKPIYIYEVPLVTWRQSAMGLHYSASQVTSWHQVLKPEAPVPPPGFPKLPR